MTTQLNTSNVIFDTVFFLPTVTDLEAFLKTPYLICVSRGGVHLHAIHQLQISLLRIFSLQQRVRPSARRPNSLLEEFQ
jgi:hypothetical protein